MQFLPLAFSCHFGVYNRKMRTNAICTNVPLAANRAGAIARYAAPICKIGRSSEISWRQCRINKRPFQAGQGALSFCRHCAGNAASLPPSQKKTSRYNNNNVHDTCPAVAVAAAADGVEMVLLKAGKQLAWFSAVFECASLFLKNANYMCAYVCIYKICIYT